MASVDAVTVLDALADRVRELTGLSVEEYREVQSYLSPDELADIERLLGGLSLPPLPFREFIRAAWPIVEPGVPYLHNWHIDAIADHLEAVAWGQIPNLIINIPPRHGKSTIVGVMFHPWIWTFRPSAKFLTYSYAQSFAVRDNIQARRIILSPWYRRLFNVELLRDANLKTVYRNTKGGHRIASGVGGSTGEGGDFILADDLLSINDRHSAAKREGANEFYATTVSTRRNGPDTASVVVCQRLHERDIVGYLEQKAEEGAAPYEVLSIPMEWEEERRFTTSIQWTDPRTEERAVLWGDRYPPEIVARLKLELGTEQSAAQLQQRPAPLSGEVFKVRYWRFWVPYGAKLPPVRFKLEDGASWEAPQVEAPRQYEDLGLSWDMAFKDLASSSYVVGQVWGYHEAKIYLLDQLRERADIVRTISMVRELSAKYPEAGAKYVEDKANGPAVVQLLNAELPGLIPVSPQGTKVARAYAALPGIESGSVLLPHPVLAPWVWDLLEECTKFPNAANDDQVDALTQAAIFMLLRRPRSAGSWRRR